MAWKIGDGVRLHRDAILRPQHVEIERGHDGGERGGRGLMAADLQAVVVLAQVIGVVDHPARQPEHLLLQRAQAFQVGALARATVLLDIGNRSLRDGYLRLSLAMLVFLSGASSTPLQAEGRSASIGLSPGGPGFLGWNDLVGEPVSPAPWRYIRRRPAPAAAALHCGRIGRAFQPHVDVVMMAVPGPHLRHPGVRLIGFDAAQLLFDRGIDEHTLDLGLLRRGLDEGDMLPASTFSD